MASKKVICDHAGGTPLCNPQDCVHSIKHNRNDDDCDMFYCGALDGDCMCVEAPDEYTPLR